MIELGKPSFVSFGGVDITEHVQAVSVAAEQATEAMQEFAWRLEPIRLTLRGKVTPYGYRTLFGRQLLRIRRMHSAYGRRRGRGRW